MNSKESWAKLPYALLSDPSLTSALPTYGYIYKYYTISKSHGEDFAFPGFGRLAEETGVSEKTIERHVQRLEKAGWIRVKRELGKLNRYTPLTTPDTSVQTTDNTVGGTTDKSVGGPQTKVSVNIDRGNKIDSKEIEEEIDSGSVADAPSQVPTSLKIRGSGRVGCRGTSLSNSKESVLSDTKSPSYGKVNSGPVSTTGNYFPGDEAMPDTSTTPLGSGALEIDIEDYKMWLPKNGTHSVEDLMDLQRITGLSPDEVRMRVKWARDVDIQRTKDELWV